MDNLPEKVDKEAVDFLIGDLNETTAQRDLYKQELKHLEQSNVSMKQYAEELLWLVTEGLNLPEDERNRLVNQINKIITS